MQNKKQTRNKKSEWGQLLFSQHCQVGYQHHSIMFHLKDSLERRCLESIVKSGLAWLSEDDELMTS